MRLVRRRISRFLAIETGIEGGCRNWRGAVPGRLQAAIDALASAGLSLESDGMSVVEFCTRQGGVQGFSAVWEASRRPTAIVAFSDISAC